MNKERKFDQKKEEQDKARELAQAKIDADIIKNCKHERSPIPHPAFKYGYCIKCGQPASKPDETLEIIKQCEECFNDFKAKDLIKGKCPKCLAACTKCRI